MQQIIMVTHALLLQTYYVTPNNDANVIFRHAQCIGIVIDYNIVADWNSITSTMRIKCNCYIQPKSVRQACNCEIMH